MKPIIFAISALGIIFATFLSLCDEPALKQQKKPIAKYNAILVRAVDGDTLDLDVDLGFNISLQGRFRILDLDTFETKLIRGTTPEEKKIGIAAKEYAARILKDKPLRIIIYSWKKCPRGRWLCQVKFDGKNYAAEMKSKGFQKVKK